MLPRIVSCAMLILSACSADCARVIDAGAHEDVVGDSGTDGRGASDAMADGPCLAIYTCGLGDNVAYPMSTIEVIASGNETLCQMFLSAAQWGSGDLTECGNDENGMGDPPWPVPTCGPCAELYACCGSIAGAAASATCNAVALEGYPTPCKSTLGYFQSSGDCKGSGTDVHPCD